MPPRLQLFRKQKVCTTPPRCEWPSTSPLSRPFTTSSSHHAKAPKKRRNQDPYALAQARARKDAHLSRQAVLQTARSAARGDPIRGITTPFLQSFDTGLPPPAPTSPPPPIGPPLTSDQRQQRPTANAPEERHLNFFLKFPDLLAAVTHSQLLSAPLPSTNQDPVADQAATASHREGHENAAGALARIASLSLGSSKDRLRVNITRCISTFGRHNTDVRFDRRGASSSPGATTTTTTMTPPMPAAGQTQHPNANSAQQQQQQQQPQQPKTPRAGPDTGSSEVQIGILTARIRTLADFLETRGKKDMVNKRNLRLLVHRRAKLCRYLREKDRGGLRWQNLVQTLGLTEGVWRGEISL